MAHRYPALAEPGLEIITIPKPGPYGFTRFKLSR